MLPEQLATETVTRLRGTTSSDTHWNDSADWLTADQLDIDGCSVQGQLGTEQLGGRDAVTWVFTWYGPPDADVKAYDRLRWRGIDYDVDGPVVPVVDPTGSNLDHSMAKLRLVEG